MALPKLNETFSYKMTLPVSGENVQYRPFVGTEEKIMLVAGGSEDTSEIFDAIGKIVENCSSLKDPWDYDIADIEALFVEIRAKSAGEVSTMIGSCEECDNTQQVDVDFRGIEVINADGSTFEEVELSDDVTVSLSMGSLSSLANISIKRELFTPEQAFDAAFILLETVIDEVILADDVIKFKEESPEDRREFVESMTSDQREIISNFVTNAPTVELKHDFTCEECGHVNKATIRGMLNFFG